MIHRIEIPKQSEAEVQSGTLKNCRNLLGKENVERRNTGGMYDPRGQFVRYGRKGNSDILCQIPSGWGEASGKTAVIECKRSDFKPFRPHKPGKPKSEDRIRWENQVARMRTCNANGGYGFWVNEKNAVIDVLMKIKAGWRVELDEHDAVKLDPAWRCELTTWSVYEVRCIPSGCVYVGWAKDAARRWIVYRSELNGQRHQSVELQAAWDFYGPSAFTYRVVAEDLGNETAAGLVELAVTEAKAVDLSYNVGHSERLTLSWANGRRKAARHTEEQKRHMSVLMKGRASWWAWKRVRVDGVEYPSLGSASKAIGVHPSTICRRLRSPKWPEWRYADAG